METKELIKYCKELMEYCDKYYENNGRQEYFREIIQRLLEFDELKELIQEVINPIIELCKYSAKIPNFQEGDIKYGRE